MHFFFEIPLLALILTLTSPLVSAKCYKEGLRFSDLKAGSHNRTVDEAILDFCHRHTFYEGWGHGTHGCYSFPHPAIGDRVDIRVRSFQSRVVSDNNCAANLRREVKACKYGGHRWISPYWLIEIDPNRGPCPKEGRPSEIHDEDIG
jgi:hypothetical protein